MQITLDKVIVTAVSRHAGPQVFERTGLVAAAVATRMPDDMPPTAHTKRWLEVRVPLSEEEFQNLVPVGTEHL